MTDRATPPTGAENVTWDLTHMYAGIDDPAINGDLEQADRGADELDATYRGRIAGLNPEELSVLLGRYAEIVELATKAGTMAHLNWAASTREPAHGALLQQITERYARLDQKLVFLELELAAAPDDVAQVWAAAPVLARYHHWLEQARLFRPHLLSEPEEKIMAEKSVTGRSAWDRFFDEFQGAAEFEFEGERLQRDQILAKLYDGDRDVRKRAAAAVTAGLQEMKRVNTFIFNTILADKASDDRLRNYPTWITARNMANQVADKVVDALIQAVTSRYDIVARYYRLKRQLLGLDELFDYDRYAPLPAADRRYSWTEARDLVLNAYGKFDPDMAARAKRFFDERWIDAAIRPGKLGGAFSHPGAPSVHPYVLVNFEAKPRDVMTLAHELGHGVHQSLAARQGILQARTPLTTAETASVFGEMLVFQDMMAQEPDPRVRLAMLTSKIEDSFATAFRQIAMNRFEHAMHTARREEGELSADRFSELWLDTQRVMFGDSVDLSENYGIWWSYVSHFIGVPGYVYAYAFGELLVLALYARYQEMGIDFAPAYLAMLAAGGSDWPHALVKPLGVDLTDLDFWQAGLRILEEMVVEAEELAEQAKRI